MERNAVLQSCTTASRANLAFLEILQFCVPQDPAHRGGDIGETRAITRTVSWPNLRVDGRLGLVQQPW